MAGDTIENGGSIIEGLGGLLDCGEGKWIEGQVVLKMTKGLLDCGKRGKF